MTNDERRKKSEARMSKDPQRCVRRFRHSDFVIPSEFPATRSSREDSPFQPGVQGVESIVLTDHRPVLGQFVLEVIGGCPFLRNVLTRPDGEAVCGFLAA